MSKLDLKTRLFLYVTGANNLGTPGFDKIKIEEEKINDVYVFDSYEEYVNYFKFYLKNIDEELIKKAIYTTSKKGQIVAFKHLCVRIIIKQRMKEFYKLFDQEKLDEIHAMGRLTPYDKVQEYEDNDLCAPGNFASSLNNRCKFFSNCHECLLEYVSYNRDYDNIDFKLIDNEADEKVFKKNK